MMFRFRTRFAMIGALAVTVSFAMVHFPRGFMPVFESSVAIEVQVKYYKSATGEQRSHVYVILKNLSEKPFLVRSGGGMFQYLDLSVTDEKGKILSRGKYGLVYLGILGNDIREVIMPGKQEKETVDPFATVRDRKEIGPGTYYVQARFDYEDTHVQSAKVELMVANGAE